MDEESGPQVLPTQPSRPSPGEKKRLIAVCALVLAVAFLLVVWLWPKPAAIDRDILRLFAIVEHLQSEVHKKDGRYAKSIAELTAMVPADLRRETVGDLGDDFELHGFRFVLYAERNEFVFIARNSSRQFTMWVTGRNGAPKGEVGGEAMADTAFYQFLLDKKIRDSKRGTASQN